MQVNMRIIIIIINRGGVYIYARYTYIPWLSLTCPFHLPKIRAQ